MPNNLFFRKVRYTNIKVISLDVKNYTQVVESYFKPALDLKGVQLIPYSLSFLEKLKVCPIDYGRYCPCCGAEYDEY